MNVQMKIFRQCAIITSLFLSFAAASTASEIRWKDVDTGLQEGKQSRKYILADVYTDWCGWCKRLDKDTFTNPELVGFVDEKFVAVKANAEDSGSGHRLATQYDVHGYPCTLVFNSDGKLIGRIVGYKDAIRYKKALENILRNPNG